LHPRDGEERIPLAIPGDLLPVERQHRRDGGPGYLAGELARRDRGGDPSRVDQLVRRRELLDAFQKEGPFLREKERSPGIGEDLAGIGLHLGEIWIECPVQSEVRGDAPTNVPAKLGVVVVIPTAWAARRGRPDGAGRDDRIQIHHETAPQLAEALQLPRLSQEARRRPSRRNPGILVSGRLNPADHVQAPVLRIGRLIAKRLEGNPHLDLESGFREASPRRVYEVRAQIRALPPGARPSLLGERPVLLHPERVDPKNQRLVAIVVGPEKKLDSVFFGQAIAVGEGGPNGPRPGLRSDPEVNGGGRVPHQDFGGLLRDPAVDRRELGEFGEPSRLPPDGLVEHAVDRHLDLDPWNRHLNAAGRAGVGREGIGGGQAGKDQREHGLPNVGVMGRYRSRTWDGAPIVSRSPRATPWRRARPSGFDGDGTCIGPARSTETRGSPARPARG